MESDDHKAAIQRTQFVTSGRIGTRTQDFPPDSPPDHANRRHNFGAVADSARVETPEAAKVLPFRPVDPDEGPDGDAALRGYCT